MGCDSGLYNGMIFMHKSIKYTHKIRESDRSDYHFIRQNSNGIWSSKSGSLCNVFMINDPHSPEKYTRYEHVKTLELVKPNLSDLSL